MGDGLPTEAQARLLMFTWSARVMRQGEPVADDAERRTSTQAACIKRGWLVPADSFGVWPSGVGYRHHKISPAGLVALGKYFAKIGGEG